MANKEIVQPVMPRPYGDYRCPLCDARYDVAGICVNDDIPLRRMGKAKV